MERSTYLGLLPAVLAAGVLAWALLFGGPGPVPAMASINDPFKRVDFSDLPALSRFAARDGASLGYRAYPGAGGWVKVGVPRIIALSILNAVGVHQFNGLTVTRFALAPQVRAMLTPQYSHTLARNFQPQRNYRANIRAAGQPLSLMAGQDDEAFYAEGKDLPMVLLPGIGHVALTLDPMAVRTAVALVGRMDR